MNAPRIAGMSDWYTANQLRNFRDGVRGVHREDFYGRQMAQISKMLNEEAEISDLVAYMNTLGDQQLAGLESKETF
jgi:cytochrome c oxidase subunit 2